MVVILNSKGNRPAIVGDVVQNSEGRFAVVNELTIDDPNKDKHTTMDMYIIGDKDIAPNDWYLTTNNEFLQCRKVLFGLVYGYGDYGRNKSGIVGKILTSTNPLINVPRMSYDHVKESLRLFNETVTLNK